MSITQDLRTRAKHRGMTPWQLVQKIGRLEREADELACEMVALATVNDELRAERGQLEQQFDRAAIDYSTALDDLRQEREENARLRAQLAPFKAAEANANRVDVPPMMRPVDGPEDEATAPIDVRPLWDALGVRPVTDPGRIA